MTQASAPRRPRGSRVLQKVAAVLLLLLAALAAERLTHVPVSSSIFNAQDRTWEVPVGHQLVLKGPEGAQILKVETAAGDGISLTAGPVLLQGKGDPIRELQWVVSPSGKRSDDNKFDLLISLERVSPAATIKVERSGGETQPQLLLGSPNERLSVHGAVIFGDLRMLPTTAVIADGVRIDDLGINLEFTLLPGGDLSLTMPTFATGEPSGMTTAVGTTERRGQRLWLREITVESEGASQPRRSACAAKPDRNLWAVLFRRSSIPQGHDCSAPRTLALTALDIGKDTISADLAGSAYQNEVGRAPTSRWLQWAGSNPVISAFMAAAYAALAAVVLKSVLGKRD